MASDLPIIREAADGVRKTSFMNLLLFGFAIAVIIGCQQVLILAADRC
jgi:hypothetical protein